MLNNKTSLHCNQLRKNQRLLIIHSGSPKTGTSFLQQLFYKNANLLLENGVYYHLFDESIHIKKSGNGIRLYNALSNTSSNYNFDAVLNEHFSSHSVALCSSEFFSELDRFQLGLFVSRMKMNNILPVFVAFVRNVFPYITSEYDQCLKTEGETRSFDNWLDVNKYNCYDFLINLGREPGVHSYVMHYDSTDDVGTSFFNAIGFDYNKISISQRGSSLNNRSLWPHEREILRYLNANLPQDFVSMVSNRLLKMNPRKSNLPLNINEPQKALIRTSFKERISFINDLFFSGIDVLSLGSDSKNPVLTSEFIAEEKLKVLEAVNLMLIDSYQNLLKSQIDIFTSKFSKIDWALKNDPRIPSNFDPYAYLLMNNDVLLSSYYPFDHYLRYGSYEGRFCSWTQAPPSSA